MPRFGEVPSNSHTPPAEQPKEAQVLSLVERRKAMLTKSRTTLEKNGLIPVRQNVQVREGVSRQALEQGQAVPEARMEERRLNHEDPSVLERIQRHLNAPQRQKELAELIQMNEAQRQQLEPLVNQSTWYVNQEEKVLDRMDGSLAGMKAQKARNEASFFRRTFAKVFGRDKILDQDIARSEQVIGERRRMFQEAQKNLEGLTVDQSNLQAQHRSWLQESTQLSKDTFQLSNLEERPAQVVEKTQEEVAREAIFQEMSEEELRETESAHRSERQVFQTSQRSEQQKAKRLQAELQTLEAQLAPSHEANLIGEFLSQVGAASDAALKKFEHAKQQRDELMQGSLFSRLFNKQSILTHEAEMKREEEVLRGLDQHFLEAQARIAAMHHDPQRMILEKKRDEIRVEMGLLERRVEQTRQRLLENDLQLTEIELQLRRRAHERPAPTVTEMPKSEQRTNVVSLTDRLNKQRAARRPRGTTSTDQQMAA